MDNNDLVYQYYYRRGSRSRKQPSASPRYSPENREMWLQIAIFLGLTCFCLLLYQGLIHSSYLSIKKISITGNQRLSDTELIELSGIKKGENLFSLNIPLIRRRLMTNPWIARVSIRLALPDKIVVKITEHIPLAIIELGNAYLLNLEGKVFKIADNDIKGEQLPRIRGLRISDIGFSRNKTSEHFKAIVNVLQLGRLPGAVLPNRAVETISADRDIGLLIRISPDADHLKTCDIQLGFGNYPEKLDRLKRIEAYMEQYHRPQLDNETSNTRAPNISAIDLSHPERVVVSPSADESLAGL